VAKWPQVLKPMKADPSLVPGTGSKEERQRFWGMKGDAVRRLMQTYYRMQDVGRIIRLGTMDPEGDGRGWAAVALVKLGRYKEAAKLAAGPDGQTPCGYQTLRYVAHSMARVGAMEAALHLSRLQPKCGRTRYITGGSREVQSIIESASLYMQATCQNMPKLLAAHGAQISMELEDLMRCKNEILALTPHRRYLMLTEPFNQLIRWYGRARLVPQALRACELMNEWGIPRDDMTIHFLSRGAAQRYECIKRAKKFTAVPGDWPGHRPEVVFVGRTNSGKSAMINALFSSLLKVAPVSKTRAWTRYMNFYEINRDRAGLPHFMMVDTPGLGHADVPAKFTRHWPELIYSYLRRRQALKHVFHLCDARNKRLLPADKQLIHLLASAQRKKVRYTIVITKIDVCSRNLANTTAENIREELGEYVDVDIMFASARSLRGVDHLWSKIWQSVTETPRGRRHKQLAARELKWLKDFAAEGRTVSKEKGPSVAEAVGLPDMPVPPKVQDFDSPEWVEEDAAAERELRAEGRRGDTDFEPVAPGERTGPAKERYFHDKWEDGLLAEDGGRGEAGAELDLGDAELERPWQDGGQGPEAWAGEAGEEEPELSDAELERRWREEEGGQGPEAWGEEDDEEDELEISDEELERRWQAGAEPSKASPAAQAVASR